MYQNDKGFEIGDVSRDGRWVALDKPNTTLDGDIFLYSVEAKELKHLTPHQGQVAFSTAAFDPAATALYFRTDEGGEYKFVRRYVLATGKIEDAVTFCSFLLPRREAVWWACRSARAPSGHIAEDRATALLSWEPP